jgi:hypothetical protein
MAAQALSSFQDRLDVLHDFDTRKHMLPRIIEAKRPKVLSASDKVQVSHPLLDIEGFDMIALVGAHADPRCLGDKYDDGYIYARSNLKLYQTRQVRQWRFLEIAAEDGV